MLLHISAAEETICELSVKFCAGLSSYAYEIIVPETRTIVTVVTFL